MKGNIQITVDTDWENLSEVQKIHEALVAAGYVINDSGCMHGTPTLSYDMTVSSWNPLAANNTGARQATDALFEIIEENIPKEQE